MSTPPKIAFCVIALIMHCGISLGQVNLVTNPSFEILYGCPSGFDQIDSVIGWSTLLNGGGGTPDLFNTCCTVPFICGVPWNSGNSTFQYPHFGNSYVEIEVARSSESNIREYLQSKLIITLSAGHSYCVTFYASLTNKSRGYITTLGAYLDNGSISALPPYGLANATSQVYNSSLQLSDTLNWMKIEGSFDATGSEEYITVGNFFSDSASGIGIIGTPSFWSSYYYIDDVSVIDADLDAHAGNDTIVHTPGDSVFIGRLPEVGLNEDCIWFVNGQPIDTIAGMWVTPDSTTTYVLQQSICGNVKYDTITITVSGVGIEPYGSANNWVRLFPNPATNTLNIESTAHITTAQIYDLSGKLLLNTLGNTQPIDISPLARGLYFIKLSTAQGRVVRKFVKE